MVDKQAMEKFAMELGDLSISEAPTFRAQREQFVAKIMEAAVLAFRGACAVSWVEKKTKRCK